MFKGETANSHRSLVKMKRRYKKDPWPLTSVRIEIGQELIYPDSIDATEDVSNSKM